ncbi:MAG: 4Fe-4S binding protein [Spirochaetes bacterium]|nr:4Fe-4S binding protein [Spirochaetota bacterium]
MVRSIIKIDEGKCTGCSLCIPNCPEGAIQMIDGKARLVSDLMCDGLGACLGHCPEGAITVEKREAEPYDERKVMPSIVKAGTNTIKAHLAHLRDHGETGYLNEAIQYLKENNINNPLTEEKTMEHASHHAGCPGSKVMEFGDTTAGTEEGQRASQLRQWPVQLHLVSPMAPYFQGKDVLLAADCVAFSVGDFHKDFLKGKSLAIACPKLDDGQETYTEKLIAMIDEAKINTLTVMIMQVPCCGGLLHLAQQARDKAKRKIPVKAITISLQGEVLNEEWVG